MSVDLEQEEIVLETIMPRDTYFAIGFGYSMIETDMILWQSPPFVNVSDLWATEFDEPEVDETDNLTWESDFIEAGQMVKITTRRPMDTGDVQDAIIELDKEMMMSYAVSTSSATFEKHESVGHFTLELKSDGQTFGAAGSRVMDIERHGWWMWVIWMPVGLLLLFSKRYMKK